MCHGCTIPPALPKTHGGKSSTPSKKSEASTKVPASIRLPVNLVFVALRMVGRHESYIAGHCPVSGKRDKKASICSLPLSSWLIPRGAQEPTLSRPAASSSLSFCLGPTLDSSSPKTPRARTKSHFYHGPPTSLVVQFLHMPIASTRRQPSTFPNRGHGISQPSGRHAPRVNLSQTESATAAWAGKRGVEERTDQEEERRAAVPQRGRCMPLPRVIAGHISPLREAAGRCWQLLGIALAKPNVQPWGNPPATVPLHRRRQRESNAPRNPNPARGYQPVNHLQKLGTIQPNRRKKTSGQPRNSRPLGALGGCWQTTAPLRLLHLHSGREESSQLPRILMPCSALR